MLVGVLADTHDRLPAIAEFTKRFREAGVGLVLHAGDFCASWSLRPIIAANLALAGVYGRNERLRFVPHAEVRVSRCPPQVHRS